MVLGCGLSKIEKDPEQRSQSIGGSQVEWCCLKGGQGKE
jgi:hypothetical protein